MKVRLINQPRMLFGGYRRLFLVGLSLLFFNSIVFAAGLSHGNEVSQPINTIAANNFYTVKVVRGERRTTNGTNRSYVLYIPQKNKGLPRPPYPLVVMVHGFLMSSNEQRYTSQFLAERGFLVLSPNMSKIMWGRDNRTKNVEDVVDQTAWLIKQSTLPKSPYYGLCDPKRTAIAGNSSGGAICFEAVLQAQKMKLPFHSMCSLEGVPWDRTFDLMKDIEPMNILTLRAEPCLCNYHWNVLRFVQELKFATDDVKINGAHHCDAEDPTTIGCMSVCGTSHDKYRRLFKLITYLYLRDTLDAPKLYEPTKNFASVIAEMQRDGAVIARLDNIQSPEVSNKTIQDEEVDN